MPIIPHLLTHCATAHAPVHVMKAHPATSISGNITGPIGHSGPHHTYSASAKHGGLSFASRGDFHGHHADKYSYSHNFGNGASVSASYDTSTSGSNTGSVGFKYSF